MEVILQLVVSLLVQALVTFCYNCLHIFDIILKSFIISERLANQIRTVEATQEKIVATMTENSRSLLETQEAILGELRRTREEMTRGLRENTESVRYLNC